MKNTEAFIALCQQVIADREAGGIDFYAAAQQIYDYSEEHPLEDDAHPMLRHVSDQVFDVLDDCYGREDNQAVWNDITNTFKNYIEGKWTPTHWKLSVMYGEYSNGRLVHSYGVIVQRQNDQAYIMTACEPVRHGLLKVIEKLHAGQTDERYLQNLAVCLPHTVEQYRLVTFDLAECLP